MLHGAPNRTILMIGQVISSSRSRPILGLPDPSRRDVLIV